MKELFPLQTFQQDAVLKRLSELYENEKDLDSRAFDGEIEVKYSAPLGGVFYIPYTSLKTGVYKLIYKPSADNNMFTGILSCLKSNAGVFVCCLNNNTFYCKSIISGSTDDFVLNSDTSLKVVNVNPILAGTEDALTGLQVGSNKYKVQQPTEVVANPTLAGTEDALTGLQVGSTKYAVGKKLYRHSVNMKILNWSTIDWIGFIYISNDSTQITKTTLPAETVRQLLGKIIGGQVTANDNYTFSLIRSYTGGTPYWNGLTLVDMSTLVETTIHSSDFITVVDTVTEL